MTDRRSGDRRREERRVDIQSTKTHTGMERRAGYRRKEQPKYDDTDISGALRGRVLIIDDKADFRERLRESLSTLGLEVVTALTGRIGLRKARELAPDMIILSLTLPDADGCELCRELKKTDEVSDAPVIVLSDAPTGKIFQRAEEAGATDCLIRPPNPSDMKSVVVKYLNE
jgi:PleD family two-component response regulator